MSKVIVADHKTDLRRGIDHIGVSASFVINDGNGRILLQKRGKGARDEQGRWDVGGGAIEFGESLDETIHREILEELCTTPLNIEFLAAYDAHRKLDDGTPTHWITILHAVKVDPSKVKIGEPHKIDEIAWFTTDNLPKPLHSQINKSLNIAKSLGIIE